MSSACFSVRRGCSLALACVFVAPMCVSGQVRYQGPGGFSIETPTSPVLPEPAVASTEAPGVDIPLGGNNEPTIAVNPLDPNNLAMASSWALRVSVDGGATWSATVAPPLPTTHICAGDPSLVFDSQGRLFWSYLGVLTTQFSADMFISQLDPATGQPMPGYPVNVSQSIGVPASSGFFHDKEWFAVDSFAASPFVDHLYLVWTQFGPNGGEVMTTSSADQGMSWSPEVAISSAGEGFTSLSHIAVAPNGDVYAAYHSQTGQNGQGEAGGNSDGVSGKVFVARSTDGGASYMQKNLAYGAGEADITFNIQTSPGTIPLTNFLLLGSTQAWVVPDPVNPNAVYVIASDDLDNVHGSGDDADVFIVRSFDNGQTWSAPTQINTGPVGQFEVMPTASIDKQTGEILISWYSNASQTFNSNGSYLLDLFYTVSQDQGATFLPAAQVSDASFNPDLGAPQWRPGPPPTLRIGEYNGVAIANNQAHFVWTGNTVDSQQIFTDTIQLTPPPPPCAADFNGDGLVNGADLASLLVAWGASGGAADLTGDGVVDGADLATLLTNWGACLN